jgi:uncharacterized membrane protein
MSEPEPSSQPPVIHRMRTSRLEAFSDGVFAIAITLLVLEIAVPLKDPDHVLRNFFAEWPSYLAYVVSFATIGFAWLAHNAVTEYMDHSDLLFARLNLLLLMVVSFMPFPTQLLAAYIRAGQAERVAATVYGLNLALLSVLLWVLWSYAVRHGLIRTDVDDEELALVEQRLRPGLALYALFLVLGLLLPRVAVFGYLAIAFFMLFPNRRGPRPDRRARASD